MLELKLRTHKNQKILNIVGTRLSNLMQTSVYIKARSFSVEAHLVPKKLRKLRRKELRKVQKARRTKKQLRQKAWQKKIRAKIKRFGFIRKHKKSSRYEVKVINKPRWKGPWRKRRRGHRPKKFRFPRWRFYYRSFWRYRFKQPGSWMNREIFSYRLYRKPHQVFRKRNPRYMKSNLVYRRIWFNRRPRLALKRKNRYISQGAHFKLFSSFYGSISPKQLRERSLHFRRIRTHKITPKQQVLGWFERRMDISLCRFRLAPSLFVARALIKQGYVFVNKEQILNPAFRVNLWDLIEIAPGSQDGFLIYWYMRNQFHRYAFKNRKLRFRAVHQQKGSLAFGFWTRLTKALEIPKRDKITTREFQRFLLY